MGEGHLITHITPLVWEKPAVSVKLDKTLRMGEGKHAISVKFNHTLTMCKAEHLIIDMTPSLCE